VLDKRVYSSTILLERDKAWDLLRTMELFTDGKPSNGWCDASENSS